MHISQTNFGMAGSRIYRSRLLNQLHSKTQLYLCHFWGFTHCTKYVIHALALPTHLRYWNIFFIKEHKTQHWTYPAHNQYTIANEFTIRPRTKWTFKIKWISLTQPTCSITGHVGIGLWDIQLIFQEQEGLPKTTIVEILLRKWNPTTPIE